jgi:hypothetical protein
MKKLISILILLLLNFYTFAQVPQGINYQAVIRNTLGTVVANTAVSIRMNVIQGSSSGTVSYSEKHNSTTNANGLVNLVIGQGTAISGVFANINWANGPYFIETCYDINNTGTFIILGSQQLMSVPYAIYARNGIQNGSIPGQMMYWDGYEWVMIPPGISFPGYKAQTLSFCNGVPTWGPCPAVLPTLTTKVVSSITGNSAFSGGIVNDDGGSIITAKGICWNTLPNPTVSDNKIINQLGENSFDNTIFGLNTSTTYYVRAFATNGVGTSYGNQLSFTTEQCCAVGQVYQGGVIAYIFQPSDPGYISGEIHGIIAAPSDQSNSIQWHANIAPIGAYDTLIGSGLSNTNMIVTNRGNGDYAAKLCFDFVLNGFDDWYMPSKAELYKLYLNRIAIGGFSNSFYWSSSDVYDYYAWGTNFGTGIQNIGTKWGHYYLRAIRNF